MKTYGGVDVRIHVFLTSTLAGGERPLSRPSRFTHGERSPRIHWIGGWVGPRTGLDDMEKRKFLTLSGLELRSLGRQPELLIKGLKKSNDNFFILIHILTAKDNHQ
jgi:hypothetical protein